MPVVVAVYVHLFSFLYTEVHIHWNEDSDLEKYIVSLYWAVTTISSVG